MTISIDVPDGVDAAIRLSPTELAAEIKLAAAIHWYSQTRISMGRAAEMAGMHRVDFLDTLAARKVDVFHVDFNELDRRWSVPEPPRIVNSSPLIFLGRINSFEVLRLDACSVIVPTQVVKEIGERGPDDRTVQELAEADWIVRRNPPPIPPDLLAWGLDAGEEAVIALAMSEPGCEVVLDDRQGRRCAEWFGIPVIGTLGILLVAKKVRRIPEVRGPLLALVASGMYLSPHVIDQALAIAGESR